jgi:ribonucleoside-triphosphate reductase (thioredoxin)
MNNISSNILSDITVHMKYAKFNKRKQRRETWKELVTRNKKMHLKKFPELKDDITWAYTFVYDKKVVPSMRSMQFAGKPIEISPNRIYNCAYTPMDDWRAFHEIMFLLLGGSGVGISVQRHHIEQLPEIQHPNYNRNRRFLIGDSIEGWGDAIKVLMKSYFQGGSNVSFDYSDIRPKGATLVTSGGKAPGPQPLKECIMKIKGILREKSNGDQLTSLEVHDIACHIADAVLAGGIRRAALISFFSAKDNSMLSCKTGRWWEANPQRGRANNSIVLMRSKVTKDLFMELGERIEASQSGEPGFIFTNDKDILGNPCNEIALRPNQMCNLTEMNVSDIESQQDLEDRAKAASILGTLQATYTDFHYLRPVWQRNTDRDALLGVSMTGIGSGKYLDYDVKAAAKIVKQTNIEFAELVGVKPAARLTCVKPSGTSSLVLKTSSGIHAWFAQWYIRRMRVTKNEAIYVYLAKYHPELIEDDFFSAHDTAVIAVPQKAPEGAILRSESPFDLLERIKYINKNWINPGHRSGANHHNISATVSVPDGEWISIFEWLWENRSCYNGISLLPFDGGTYTQPPFEECTEERYNELMEALTKIDLTKVVEIDDNTDLSGELACAGGACEL